MSVLRHFSDDYVTSRAKFVAACRAAGVEPQRWINPARSIDDIELSTEVALFGDPHAPKLLVLVSGVHGVEALCGSACQTGMLAEPGALYLPNDTALLMVHAINCWGAANLRRNNEDNVDLCRNFVDFDETLPVNEAYEGIHHAIDCAELEGPRQAAAQELLAEYRQKHGMAGFIQALMGGQYRHPDGFSFGGHQTTWSNRTLTKILAPLDLPGRRVAVIEYHSGLGAYASGMAVTMQVGESLERARNWFGKSIEAPNAVAADEPSSGHLVTGHTTSGYTTAMPQTEITAIVLEFGTVPPNESLPVMLQDHWLHRHGNPRSDAGRRISRRLLELHHPSDPDWRYSVWQRCREVTGQALAGLQA